MLFTGDLKVDPIHIIMLGISFFITILVVYIISQEANKEILKILNEE